MLISQPTLADHALPRGETQASLTPPASSFGWKRILVAIDGTVTTDSALRAAHAIAKRTRCAVDVTAIYAPRIPLPKMPHRHGLAVCERKDRHELAQLARTVRSRCRSVVPRRCDRESWRFHLEVGDPGATVVRLARELQADLVILGLSQHDLYDTLADERTAICAARYLGAPMLAALSHDDVIARAVVVLPDGRLHDRTLRAVLATVARPAKLWVVLPESALTSKRLTDSDALLAAIRSLCGPDARAMLDGIRLESLIVGGDMLSGTLRVAEELNAQLIAIPNYGDPGPVRSFLPNLAEPLLFGARCAVLVVPDAEVAST